MKTSLLLGSIVALLCLNSGCSKPEQTEAPATTPPAAAESTTSAMTNAGETLKNEANKAAEGVQSQTTAAQQSVSKAATDVQAQATSAANAAGNSLAAGQDQSAATAATVQTSIDKVRKLIADKNWTEASKELAQLTSLKLTPAQQADIDSLKQEIQKLTQNAAAGQAQDQATKAVGNLLNNK